MPPDGAEVDKDKHEMEHHHPPQPEHVIPASTTPDDAAEATAEEDKRRRLTKRVSWSAEVMQTQRSTRSSFSAASSKSSSSRTTLTAMRSSLSLSNVKKGSKYFRTSAVSLKLELDSIFCEAGHTLTGTLVVDVNRFFVVVDMEEPLLLTIKGQEATQVDYFTHETPGKSATVGHGSTPSGHYGKRRATEVRTIWEQNCTLSEEALQKLWEKNKEEEDANNNENNSSRPSLQDATQDTSVRKLYKGTHRIPFSVSLPDRLPGTMRMDHKRRLGRRKFLHHNLCVDFAKIQYELTATLKKGEVTEHNVSFRRNKSNRSLARGLTITAPTTPSASMDTSASSGNKPFQCSVEVTVTPKEPRPDLLPYDSGESVHKVKRCGYLYCGQLSQQISVGHSHLQPGQHLNFSIAYQNHSSTSHVPRVSSVKVMLKEKIDWYAEAVSQNDDTKNSDSTKKKHDNDNSSHKPDKHKQIVKRRHHHFSQDLATQELLANEHEDHSFSTEREQSFCVPIGDEQHQNKDGIQEKVGDALLKPTPQFTASTLMTNIATTATTTSISSSSLQPEDGNAEDTTKPSAASSGRTHLRHPTQDHRIVSFSGQLLIPKIHSHSTYPLPTLLTTADEQKSALPSDEDSKEPEKEDEEKTTDPRVETAADDDNNPGKPSVSSSPLICVRHELVIKTQLKHCKAGVPERRIPVYITDLDLTRRSMLSSLHEQPQLQVHQPHPEPVQRGVSSRSTDSNHAAAAGGQQPPKRHNQEGNLRESMLSGVKAKGSIKKMSWKAIRQKMAKGSHTSAI